jgi:solute carrier family 13 (sodium-dependent dicarboxylate transporter), member 2/3/5
MAVVDSVVTQPASHDPANRNPTLRLVQAAATIAVPIAVMLAPVELPDNTRAALAIAAFMIIAWATEVMEYTAAGLIGLLLFWFFKAAEPEVIFRGFVDPAVWYYFGAVLLGTIAMKSGLTQGIGNFVVSRVGLTYSRLLLGLIVIDFLLTFIVPPGTARVVIMAPLCITVIDLFGAGRGSNIGRGVFLLVTYASATFDKMIIAGTGAITARGFIERVGEVDVNYSFWLLAFLPCSILTIFAGWRLTLWLFPPEVESLEGRREEILARFRTQKPITPESMKSAALVTLALGLWLTDSFHDIPAAMIAFGVGLLALLPFIDVLNIDDLRKANILPFFFVGAALGMSEVLRETGGLQLLTNAMMAEVEPYLQDRTLAVPFLYWTAFVYHFFTASEIPMLATSLPVLMEYAKTHMLDPLWVGMVWSFSAGGKLFAYQSAPLVVGYSYGYFRHTDLIKLGGLITILEFFALAFCVAFWWPLFGF